MEGDAITRAKEFLRRQRRSVQRRQVSFVIRFEIESFRRKSDTRRFLFSLQSPLPLLSFRKKAFESLLFPFLDDFMKIFCWVNSL